MQAPEPHVRLQIEPLSHLALHSSLPLHVNAHVLPATHKHSWVAVHVSVVVRPASYPASVDVLLVLLLELHATTTTERKRTHALFMARSLVGSLVPRTWLDGDLPEKNRALSSRDFFAGAAPFAAARGGVVAVLLDDERHDGRSDAVRGHPFTCRGQVKHLRNAVKIARWCWSAFCKRGRHHNDRQPRRPSVSGRRYNLFRGPPMIERRKRMALRTSCLHDLLDREDVSALSERQHRAGIAQEIAERVAERLASRKPFRSPENDLLAGYRSME
jgi:hypothetical protein